MNALSQLAAWVDRPNPLIEIRVTIVAAGITVHEALAAHGELRGKRIAARVIDAYSIKPLDRETLRRAAQETGRIVVVEDHVLAGRLGEAVTAAVGTAAPVHRLGIGTLPHSGTMEELLDRHGMSRYAIAAAVAEPEG